MTYQFGCFFLDSASRQLLKDGLPVKVSKRVFDCLLFLLEHRQRAVPRDELIRNVWGRDNVSDHQLAQVVLSARQLLGDDGTAQKMIRTVPGLGYHWVGSVTAIAAGASAWGNEGAAFTVDDIRRIKSQNK